MDVIRFALGIRALRRKRGWTQDELAGKAQVSQTAVWRIERGHADRVVPDMQAMLSGIDRKGRLARDIARERGWHVTSVTRLLVLPDDPTARRRVERHAATFKTALPARTLDVRRWIQRPDGTMNGVLFLSDAHHASARHRVASRRPTGHANSSVMTDRRSA